MRPVLESVPMQQPHELDPVTAPDTVQRLVSAAATPAEETPVEMGTDDTRWRRQFQKSRWTIVRL